MSLLKFILVLTGIGSLERLCLAFQTVAGYLFPPPSLSLSLSLALSLSQVAEVKEMESMEQLAEYSGGGTAPIMKKRKHMAIGKGML